MPYTRLYRPGEDQDQTFSWHLLTLSLTQHMQLAQTCCGDRSPPIVQEEEKQILRPRGSILEGK